MGFSHKHSIYTRGTFECRTQFFGQRKCVLRSFWAEMVEILNDRMRNTDWFMQLMTKLSEVEWNWTKIFVKFWKSFELTSALASFLWRNCYRHFTQWYMYDLSIRDWLCNSLVLYGGFSKVLLISHLRFQSGSPGRWLSQFHGLSLFVSNAAGSFMSCEVWYRKWVQVWKRYYSYYHESYFLNQLFSQCQCFP